MPRNTKQFGSAPRTEERARSDFDNEATRAQNGRAPTGGGGGAAPAPDNPHAARPATGNNDRTAISRVPVRRDKLVGAGAGPRGLMDAGATVMMQPETGAEDASPIAQTHEPPEIGLTQHEIPEGATIDRRLVLVDDPDSARAASFRILRHHLLEKGRPQVVVVSSPRPGDGKTTTAVNLALALAECGRARVLLVGASVKHPSLARVFRFRPPWCFAEQLVAHRNQPLLPWGLVHIPSMWLHVAAMNPDLEQTQLLDAPAFSIAMERLRLAGYDHIVIDAPSVLGTADVNLIQDSADGVVLAVRSKASSGRDLRRAVEQLSPTKILGTVLLE